ncbi:hypothetical protein K432DRAFT_381990 [Lepidopterella palustris CBS 459.81]|uniref:Uncharacterized protein n=1 Tax=Lepidopterella palustris CBS 459.81 TaxID=1314670 RepID=A0A8E2JFF8_9PEZI|nr:hypothetical protein K432DRAFT_381990 [Lepidopterella palustris CBS 459.81]
MADLQNLTRSEAVGEDDTKLPFEDEQTEMIRDPPRDHEIAIIIANTPDEAAQIDAIAAVRNWFRPEDDAPTLKTMLAYTSGSIDAETAAQQLADPVDRAYSTADYGAAIRRAERCAANQRQHWSVEEGKERWGEPLPASEIPVDDGEKHDSTEGLLWDLWYTILHFAKRTPWRDAASQTKLVNLVKTLKARPDPPSPQNTTKALRNDWIWSSGSLWSNLIMLGPSARECWNDSPGCGAGFLVPEIHAWTNVNAFVARLTREGLADFWLYAIWAMRPALEEKHSDYEVAHKRATAAVNMDALVPAAAVWVLVAGRELWEKREDLTRTNKNEGDPAKGGEMWKGKSEFSRERWAFWRRRFGEEAENGELSEETRRIAKEAAERMEEIEREGGE